MDNREIIRNSVIVAALFCMVGCSSSVPFTKALMKEYNLTSKEMRQLQFYISDDIILEREQTSVDKNIDETYALKKVEDKYISQIKFERLTPCIVTEVSGDRLRVALEPKDNLTFSFDPSNRKGQVFVYKPDVMIGQPEERSGPRESGSYGWSVVGKDTYAGEEYEVLCRRSLPYLIVDERSLRNMVIEARTVPGMRQGEAGGGVPTE